MGKKENTKLRLDFIDKWLKGEPIQVGGKIHIFPHGAQHIIKTVKLMREDLDGKLQAQEAKTPD